MPTTAVSPSTGPPAGSRIPSASRDVLEYVNKGLYQVHSAIRGATENIITRAPIVAGTAGAADFLKYLETYLQFVRDHHRHEDTIFFPAYAAKGVDVKTYEEDHHGLHDVLEAFSADVKALSRSGKKIAEAFDAKTGETIAGHAQKVKDFLFPHLKKEEDLIFSEGEIKLKFTPDEMRELKKKLDAQLQVEDPFTSLPFFVYHLSPETREWMLFEDMPWIVKRVLLPYVFSWRFKGAWMYAPEYGTGKI